MTALRRVHGGPDADGASRWDFSTCANAAGPCPSAWKAARTADLLRYPDPGSTAVRRALAELHGVAPSRILPAASASEFIQRITAVGARLMPGAVGVPTLSYADYAVAARACARAVHRTEDVGRATLRWYTEPSSPLGLDDPPPVDAGARPTVLDAVYAPLRLAGVSAWDVRARDAVFVLHSPNKALGLSGIRGAYAVAPAAADYDVSVWREALEAAAPSWPLSAQAEAMLRSWASDAVQRWVMQSHATLATWKAGLQDALEARGFAQWASVTPHLCVQPPRAIDLRVLREHGVAVRDAASFGLDGWWRVSAQPPEALTQLRRAVDAALASRS